MTDCEFLVVLTPLTFRRLMQNLLSIIHAKFQKIPTKHVKTSDKRIIRLGPKCSVSHCVFMQNFETLSVISHSHKDEFHHFFQATERRIEVLLKYYCIIVKRFRSLILFVFECIYYSVKRNL